MKVNSIKIHSVIANALNYTKSLHYSLRQITHFIFIATFVKPIVR